MEIESLIKQKRVPNESHTIVILNSNVIGKVLVAARKLVDSKCGAENSSAMRSRCLMTSFFGRTPGYFQWEVTRCQGPSRRAVVQFRRVEDLE